MSIVGIQLDLKDNTSSVSPRIVDNLTKIGEAGERAGEQIQQAFSSTNMGVQFDKLADKMQQLPEMNFGRERELKMRNMELRNQQLEQRLNAPGKNNIIRFPGGFTPMTPGQTIGRTGQTLSQIGQSGDAMGAGADALGSLSGVVSKLGPVGMGIAAVGTVVAGTAVVVDALSKQYENFLPAVMDTTAAMGDLKDNMYDTSASFRENMKAAGESANKFGYDLDQGLAIFQALAKGGISGGRVAGESTELMSYARGFGVSPGNLTNAQILANRYSQGNVLGLAAGGTQMSGIGAGRYEEYLTALTGTFEEALSRGVVKGFDEISATMNFFSGLGETWKGALGQQRIQQLNQSFTGATSLQSESDVLMYRAAGQVAGSRGGGTGTYLDAMLELEKGITPELFKAFGEQVESMTGGNRLDMVEMFREAFNTNYQTSLDLIDAYFNKNISQDKLTRISGAPSADSIEQQLIQAQNDLKMEIIELGASVIDAKRGVLEAAHTVVDGLSGVVGGGVEAQTIRLQEKEVEAQTKAFAEKQSPRLFENFLGVINQSGNYGLSGTLENLGITQSLQNVMTNPQYASQQGFAESMISLLSGSSMGALNMLQGNQSSLSESLLNIGNRDYRLDPNEIQDFLPILQQQLGSNEQNIYEKVGGINRGGRSSLSDLRNRASYDYSAGDWQNEQRMSLMEILNFQEDLSKNKGLFESREKYEQRSSKGQDLLNALTGISPEQLDLLLETGGISQISTSGKTGGVGSLRIENVDQLIAAIKDMTAVMLSPVTITTEAY